MEDDDEFGDLYTDVLRPLTTASFQPQLEQSGAPASRSRPIDLNITSDDEEILYGARDDSKNSKSNPSRPIDLNITSDDEEILYGVRDSKNSKSNPSSSIGWNLNAPVQENNLAEPLGFDLNLDSNLEVSRVDELAGDGGSGLGIEARVLDMDEGVQLREKASGRSNFMDDDDDIDIVLDEREDKDDNLVENDNFIDNKENTTDFGGIVSEQMMIPGLSGGLENPRGSNFEDEWESDESEDDLQIVLNENNHGPMGMDDDDEDGEPLVIVADNGDAGHHHMMMEDQQWGGEEGVAGADGERKELGEAATPAAVQPKVPYNNHVYHHSFHSQFKYVRPGATPIPPVTVGPAVGRGRGDWRPPLTKGTVPMHKYGVPAWGVNGAGRGYGSGLDFTLPSHKTIFEVDIDTFEEKPWKLSGIDVSDFFNFGLSEDSWKDYCKQLEQLRLGTTMQNKIRVYESGRAEQDYDPDLPPELAAAVGIQDIPSENANPGKINAGPIDIGRSSVNARPPLPAGRPIPVETGAGERLPSVDTRRQRTHDTDAIIEIFCQGSIDGDDMAEQQDNDLQQDDVDHVDRFSPAYSGDDILRKDVLHSPRVASGEYHSDREIGGPDEKRSTKVRVHARSPEMAGEKHIVDDHNGESFDVKDSKQSPSLSSLHTIGSDEAVVVRDDMNDDSVTDDRSFDLERAEIAVDERDNPEDDNFRNTTKRDKRSSRVELSQETARSSENSKGRSGSSRDNKMFSVEDEVIQHRRPPRAVDIKKPAENENSAHRKGRDEIDETERHHIVVKGREESYSHRKGHQRDDDHNGKRVRIEEQRKQVHGRDKVRESDVSEKDEYHQSRNQLDNSNWRAINHDPYMGSRQRDRDDIRYEKVDDLRSKRRKEDISHNHIETSLRKRGRDDQPKLKDDNLHYVRQKDEASFQRERSERWRENDEWHRLKQDEILSRREREDKTWTSHSRGKDEYKGSGREYPQKDVGRHGDQLKRRDSVENGVFSLHRGHEDVYARGNNQLSNNDKRARHERVAYASDPARMHEHKQKESSRKSKGSESGDQRSSSRSKRNQNEHGGHISETVNLRVKTEQQSGENEIHLNRQSSKKHKQDGAISDDEQTDSRKGRSKLERWTSHKERDFTITATSSSLKTKDGTQLLVNEKDIAPETNDNVVNKVEDDSVEKLRKRSEHFKPSEKDDVAIKKLDSEPFPPTQTNPEIKSERPARKRRWTGK